MTSSLYRQKSLRFVPDGGFQKWRQCSRRSGKSAPEHFTLNPKGSGICFPAHAARLNKTTLQICSQCSRHVWEHLPRERWKHHMDDKCPWPGCGTPHCKLMARKQNARAFGNSALEEVEKVLQSTAHMLQLPPKLWRFASCP